MLIKLLKTHNKYINRLEKKISHLSLNKIILKTLNYFILNLSTVNQILITENLEHSVNNIGNYLKEFNYFLRI